MRDNWPCWAVVTDSKEKTEIKDFLVVFLVAIISEFSELSPETGELGYQKRGAKAKRLTAD